MFPLVLIAVVQLRPAVHFRLRRIGLYRWSIQFAISSSVGGLIAVVIGQQLGGLPGPLALLVWALFALNIFSLVLTVLVVSATSEVEEEKRHGQLRRIRTAARAALRK